MSYPLKFLQRAGLVATMVIGGVLGGLMAPVPSQADPPPPTLMIGGQTITNLIYYGDGCGTGNTPAERQTNKFDTGYNTCWSIPSADGSALPVMALSKDITTEALRTIGRVVGTGTDTWHIASYAATNKARVLIHDVSTQGAVDGMKMTGTSITPTAGGTAIRETDVVLTNTFNQPDGGPATLTKSNYSWAPSQGGTIDPFPNTQNAVDSGLRLTGTGNVGDGHVGNIASLVATAHNPIKGPSVPANTIGSVTESKTSATVKESDNLTPSLCNTGTVVRNVGNTPTTFFLCAPTITYTYHVTIKGLDILNLTDSIVGCGGDCFEFCGEDFDCVSCAEKALQCDNPDTGVIPMSTAADGDAADAVGAVPVCGTDCIVTMVNATPPKKGGNKTFPFTVDGQGVGPSFNVKTNVNGIGGHVDQNIGQPTFDGTLIYTIGPYPTPLTQTDSPACVSALNNGTTTWRVITSGSTSKTKTGLEVLTWGAGDTLTCVWHVL